MSGARPSWDDGNIDDNLLKRLADLRAPSSEKEDRYQLPVSLSKRGLHQTTQSGSASSSTNESGESGQALDELNRRLRALSPMKDLRNGEENEDEVPDAELEAYLSRFQDLHIPTEEQIPGLSKPRSRKLADQLSAFSAFADDFSSPIQVQFASSSSSGREGVERSLDEEERLIRQLRDEVDVETAHGTGEEEGLDEIERRLKGLRGFTGGRAPTVSKKTNVSNFLSGGAGHLPSDKSPSTLGPPPEPIDPYEFELAASGSESEPEDEDEDADSDSQSGIGRH